MHGNTIEKKGYSYSLVNIECLPNSEHFNIVMNLAENIEELLPYLAAELPGCTYVHGSGVINLMDAGHIVAIYPEQITITDVLGKDDAEGLCSDYFARINRVREHKSLISPVFEKRLAINVLGILRGLPRTNCGLCLAPTCMAFAARVFRREACILACDPIQREPQKYRQLLLQLQTNGYETS